MKFALLAAVVLVAQACALPHKAVTPFDPLEYDKTQAQYALSKQSAEATVYRMRCYVLALETSHPLKYNDRFILGNLTALGVDEADVDILSLEMRDKGDKINQNIIVSMTEASDLVDLLNTVSSNVAADNKAGMTTDLIFMVSQRDQLDLAFTLGQDNVMLAIEVIRLKVENLLVGQEPTDEFVMNINALMDESTLIMTTEQEKINAAKAVLDLAGDEAYLSVQKYLNALP